MKKTIFVLLLVSSCSSIGIPEDLNAVDDFDVNRYLGTWYEIARLDHSFECGLSNVSATYTLRDDGGINVLNKGYDKESGEWEEAHGKAYLFGDMDIGRLKVTFFWPFYAGYNIIFLDKEEYSYSIVCGPDMSYLWILSRKKKMDGPDLNMLLQKAKKFGFETDKLIMVEHDNE